MTGRELAKRAFDLGLVILTTPAWLPVLVVVSILVRLVQGSPVLFRQQRPGRNGVPFDLVKFRTMSDTLGPDGRELPDGQRLTRLGRFLRSTSLDELPEIWNVVKGELSLVGPRPLLMEYLPLYDERQRRRHDVPPGITGWAQVNGRNAVSWNERFAMDLWYVEHQSLALDLRILWLTVLTVLRRRDISAPGEATMPRFTGNQS